MNVDDKILDTMALLLGVPKASLNETSSVDTISQWDSVKHMELVIGLEDAFGIQFEDQEVADLLNFKLIRSIVLERLATQG